MGYLISFVLVFQFITFSLFSCTTMLITKGATKDGSVIVAHTDDDEFGDQRLVYVPAKDYPKNAKRPLYKFDTSNYPRYVGTSLSTAYDLSNYPATKPLGYIDQVEHTYAYIEGNYSIMNEKQLAIGECTNSTYFYFEADKDKRRIAIEDMSRIALERCSSAKEAIILIGALAEKNGYYGWGETLLFADKNEGWVFEISCDPEGTSAIWVAKKIPDGEIFVAANQFRIQDVLQNDPDMLYSSNLFSLAKKYKWLDEKNNLNWLKAVCPGEFDHPYYTLRRVWRAFSLFNPSLNLSPWVDNAYTTYYPFSIKPQKKVDLPDVIRIYRDHYEGTEFDLTKGLAAGPYDCPNRFIGSYDRCDYPNKRKDPLEGAWERSISIYYTGYTYITKLRSWLPDEIGGISWIALDDPYLSCFIPFYAGINTLPKAYQYGSPIEYDNKFAWWGYNIVSNWVSAMYNYALKDVQQMQLSLENSQISKQNEIEKEALSLYKTDKQKAKEYLTSYCTDNADFILKKWWGLAHYLMEKFNNGYINKPKMAQPTGYPKWWLNDVGYKNGPITYEKKKNED